MTKKKLTSALLIAPVVLAGIGATALTFAGSAQAAYCSGGVCSGMHMGQRFYWRQ